MPRNNRLGTQQGPVVEKYNQGPASKFNRSHARSSNTPTKLTNDWAKDKAARDKKHGTGKYSKQRLFP